MGIDEDSEIKSSKTINPKKLIDLVFSTFSSGLFGKI